MVKKFDPNSIDFANYYNSLPFWSANFGQLLLDSIPLKDSIKVLDIGCGTGFPLLEIAERLDNTSELVGIDPWNAANSYLKKKIEFMGASNIQVISGDSTEIPYDNNYFDLIVSNLGLNNFDNSKEVIRECKRVLSDNGKLSITTNFKGHMSEFYTVYRESLRELKLEEYFHVLEEDENRRRTLSEIEELFLSEGLSLNRAIEKKFKLRYSSGRSFFNSNFLKVAFFPSWSSLVGEENWREASELIIHKLNLIAKEEGEFKVTVPMVYMEFEK